MGKIMLVDDSHTFRMQIKVPLEKNGHNVFEAENGRDALAMLEENAEIDLIFCDVNMPEMDGLTLCKKIKENEKIKNIPIVMLTTESGSDMVAKGKQLGVKAWMPKYFSDEKILLVVNNLLSKK